MGSDKLDEETLREMRREFKDRLDKMLGLLAIGRGIEILVKVADQTREGLVEAATYESMMGSAQGIPSQNPTTSLRNMFPDGEDRARIELARDVADKLAHGLYRRARKLIDRYRTDYGLKAAPTSDPLPGWRADTRGHLLEEDGRRIESIVETITSSKHNLMLEEFDLFVHNGYDKAATEIIQDAWNRLTAGQGSLAVQSVKLRMLRGFKRGKRTYVKGE